MRSEVDSRLAWISGHARRGGGARPRRGVVAAGLALLAVSLLLATAGRGEEDGEAPILDWTAGPATVPVGDSLAEIEVPEGFLFLDGDGTRQLMELFENPVHGAEVGTLAPASDDEGWFLVFEWDPIGWVDDAEHDELDADALIAAIREGTAAANEERRERGWAEVEVVGWHEAPHYDPETNNLVWAIEGRSGGDASINRMMKILGRRGVMSITLVASPEELPMASAASDQLLAGYHFVSGSRYADYVPGTDKLATYGLAALVTGGLGAAALKSGLLARFWKFIVFGVVAVGAGLKRVLGGRKHIADPPTPG